MAKPKRAQRPAGAQRAAGGAGSATKTRPATSGVNGVNSVNGSNGNATAAKANGASGSGTNANSANGKTNGATGSSAAKTSTSDRTPLLSGVRARVPAPRPTQNRRRYAVNPWWKGWRGTALVGVAILVIVGIFAWVAYQANQASAIGVGSPVPSTVMNQVTNVPSSVFSTVGAGRNPIQMQALPASTPKLTADSGAPIFTVGGHPEILFVGGEYCPYCAAERWGLVIALSRFGTFKNLHLMKSSHTDVYPDTNTFTFYQSSYTSKYIVFTPVEIADRSEQALQSLTSAQQQIVSTYDNAPYTQSAGSIPFTYYGGFYVTVGTPFIPSSLQGLSWQQIASGLSDPTNAATQDIIGTANQMTAAICMMDNQQPGAVCQSSTIQQIEKKLPKRQ